MAFYAYIMVLHQVRLKIKLLSENIRKREAVVPSNILGRKINYTFVKVEGSRQKTRLGRQAMISKKLGFEVK